MPKKRLRDRARTMRTDPSDAEQRLWLFLRARQLRATKFRRQAPIGSYIADFVAFERKLIIELDGGQNAQHKLYDQQRMRWLESEGFRVLRFWNNEVLEETEAVVHVIWRALKELEFSAAKKACEDGLGIGQPGHPLPSPPHSPKRRGEGGRMGSRLNE